MPDLVFRLAITDDAHAIAARAQSAYRGEGARRGWTTEADLIPGERISAGEVRALVDRPLSVVLLAEDAAGLAGCVHVEAADGAGHLGLLAVDPARQAMGLGRRLVVAAEALARDRFGVAEMRMKVIHSRVELIGWYERQGYVRTGEVAPFPVANADLGVGPEVDLHFVVLGKPLAGRG